MTTYGMASSVILLNDWRAMDIKIAEFQTDPQLEKWLENDWI